MTTHYQAQPLMREFVLLRDTRIGCSHCDRWVWGEDAAVALPKKNNHVPLYYCWPHCAAVGAADGKAGYPARRLL